MKNLSLIGGAAVSAFVSLSILSSPAHADPFFFSTGSPDGLIATLSRVASPGKLETETADDFVTNQTTIINSATFTGLLPSGTPLGNVTQVEIELYHVFPLDSTFPPDGRVLTRTNSPSDNNFDARDSNIPGQLAFTVALLNPANPAFTALNSVVNGIHAQPNQFTGGEGSVTGEEVQITVTFTTPFVVGADHIFFRPEVGVTNGDFLWLSAFRPGTGLFPGDLQSWIRNDGTGALAPDWERIGTDVTRQGPFNASFSLAGQVIPEPTSLALFGTALIGFGLLRRRKQKRHH